jgi:hypothetical protein
MLILRVQYRCGSVRVPDASPAAVVVAARTRFYALDDLPGVQEENLDQRVVACLAALIARQTSEELAARWR